jgi:hypothetical protein
MTALNEDCLAWSNFSGKPQPNNDGFNSYWVRFRWGKSEKLTLSQTVTLPAGDWKLSADAFFNGASGASATIFAADERTAITGNSTWANYFVTFVSDGETPVTIGFNVTQTTTIENIAAFDNFTLVSYDPLADAKAGLQAEVEAAEAVLTVYADFTEGLDAFTEAIETAKAVLENADSPTDVDNATETLKAAVADFMFANQSLYDGVVYVIDAESGKMMAAGHNWGTRGIVNEQGLDLTFASNVDSRTVTIDSKVFESDSKHFLGSNLYMDAIAFGWILLEHGNGFHISNGEQYISTDADDNLVLSDTPHEWLIVSAEDMLEQRMAELARATDENPVDATFLISGPNFNRNDQRNAAWTIVQGLTGSGHSTNISGGNNVNNCAEAYHTDFTISQILEGAPAGMYTLTAQGFYSQAGNTEEDVPYFFISENGAAVPVKTGDESSMEKASESFTAGLYTIEPIEFFHDGESEFQIGVTTKGQNQWVAFDNFRLTYYGGAEEPVMAGDLNGDEEISVSDAVVVVSIINEKIEATATQMKAADVTADGSVDVADVQAIVNLALGIEDEAGAAGARIATDNDYLTIDGQEIGLNNTSRFTAFQMDVTLTEGAVLNGVSLSDRAADMQLDYNRVGQNTYRIVAFSGSRTAISGNEGALLNLDITGNSDMTISKVTFVDAAARSYSVGLGTVTGINALGIDAANADIYTTDGVRNGQLRKGINVVRMANGQVKKVAVK